MFSSLPRADEDEITRKLLDDLWQRLLPQTAERLHLLDQAAVAAANGALTPMLQAEAAATAHKFAGSLGMFGFHEGTRVALKLEEQLSSPTPDLSALATLVRQLQRSIPQASTSSPRSFSDVTE